MIIWGWRGVTSSTGKGSFHCPSCNAERGYAKKRTRRFFTLYFIPLIPLNVLGEWVECSSCLKTYKDEVLLYDPKAENEALKRHFQRAIGQVMCLMLSDRGSGAAAAQLPPASASEFALVRRAYRDATGVDREEAVLSRDLASFATDKTEVMNDLTMLSPALNETGKETLVRAALRAAMARGPLQPAQNSLLADIARAVDMTPAHLKGIIADTHADA